MGSKCEPRTRLPFTLESQSSPRMHCETEQKDKDREAEKIQAEQRYSGNGQWAETCSCCLCGGTCYSCFLPCGATEGNQGGLPPPGPMEAISSFWRSWDKLTRVSKLFADLVKMCEGQPMNKFSLNPYVSINYLIKILLQWDNFTLKHLGCFTNNVGILVIFWIIVVSFLTFFSLLKTNNKKFFPFYSWNWAKKKLTWVIINCDVFGECLFSSLKAKICQNTFCSQNYCDFLFEDKKKKKK